MFWGLLLLQKNVRCVVLPHSDGCAIGVVEEVKDIIPIGHTDKLGIRIVVVINYPIDCLAGAKSVKVISIGDVGRSVGSRQQLTLSVISIAHRAASIGITGDVAYLLPRKIKSARRSISNNNPQT